MMRTYLRLDGMNHYSLNEFLLVVSALGEIALLRNHAASSVFCSVSVNLKQVVHNAVQLPLCINLLPAQVSFALRTPNVTESTKITRSL
jgi:hypothetical protein